MLRLAPLNGPDNRAHRIARIARGFADAGSRPRYIDAAKRRVRGQQPDPSADRCLVCGAADVERRTVHSAKNPDKIRDLRVCRKCGHVGLPDNRNDYAERNYDQLPAGGRTGADGAPGRDYHIATLALRALARNNAEVLLYGVGASRDNHHIAELPQVKGVAIGDIMKLRDDGEFIDLTQPPPRRFPLVIASEVVEHFRDPRPDFSHMFEYVSRGGLLVCGTNVYDGGDLAKDPYIFYSDHTSYYTPEGLAIIANAHGYHIDFRMPAIGAHLRKRYVMFTKSRRVLDRLAVYFGSHPIAPSESPRRLRVHNPQQAKTAKKK